MADERQVQANARCLKRSFAKFNSSYVFLKTLEALLNVSKSISTVSLKAEKTDEEQMLLNILRLFVAQTDTKEEI